MLDVPQYVILRHAAARTRGWHFVTARSGGESLIRNQLVKVVRPVNAGVAINPAANTGGAGVGHTREDSQQLNPADWESVWGEDHGGTLVLGWPSQTGCFGSAGFGSVQNSWVKSNHADLFTDDHHYAGSGEPQVRHDLRGSGATRNSWPWALEYNYRELANPNNDFGQPKLYAIVERDFAQRATPYPWDLFFKFRFSASGEGAAFDLGRKEGTFKSPAGADLQHQVAISSAIVYYHRPVKNDATSAWDEPPNLWNPFWRATLYAPDDDLPKYLEKAGYPEHADSVRRLLNAGIAGTL